MQLPRRTTGRLTASKAVKHGPCNLYGCLVETNGVNDATLILYDNKVGSGKIARKLIIPGAQFYGGFEFPVGIEIETGIYASIAGTGAAFWVTYGDRELLWSLDA